MSFIFGIDLFQIASDSRIWVRCKRYEKITELYVHIILWNAGFYFLHFLFWTKPSKYLRCCAKYLLLMKIQFLESQKFSPETRNLCKNISKERRDNNKDCETGQKDNSVLIGSWIVANEFHEHKCENILPKLGVKSCLKPINQTMIHNLDSKPRRLSNFRSHKFGQDVCWDINSIVESLRFVRTKMRMYGKYSKRSK